MTSPVIGTPWKKLNAPVSEEALEGVDKYWRVANYLSIGQIYLRSNPLMKEPFTREDVKHRLVGHWGTTPGLNFLICHINRFIADHGQNTVFIMGPGHGGPAGTSQSYLDGTYTETYPNITKDEAGLQKFFRQFSYPGGIPSHFAPETPGSIHEGGELGYALSHAYGAIMDNPSLFVPCIVGDGEAETGPLATSWQLNKFINAKTDGASGTSEGGFHLYNMGTGQGCSVLQLVQAFERVNGVPIPLRFRTRRSGDVASCWCDASKAERELGWKAVYGIEDMCRDAWNWEKSKRGKAE